MRTNLTTRALATRFDTSQTALDPINHHLVPVLARTLRPDPDNSNHAWIIDGTLIPVHDQLITAFSNNDRRGINAQITICSHPRRVVIAGTCWPGNGNDVVVARATLAHPLTGQRHTLGDGGYRGIAAITAPRRDNTGPTIGDHRYRTHRRIKARVDHVLARLKH
jgi:hypothetical protein